MRIIILGSAAGGGFPQWNCLCPNCARARAGDPAALPRTQSSAAVSTDGRQWFLLNCSPDIRWQVEQTPDMQPRRAVRDSPIAGVILTNADVDHVAGLLSLRESQPFILYATGRVLAALADNPIFAVLRADLVQRRSLSLDDPIALQGPTGAAGGLTIEAFAVPGKVALYLEDPAAMAFGSVAEDTVGLKLSEPETGRSFFYLPGCAAMPPALAERLRDAELVLFDGTTWRDDEMPASGAGAKTAGRMGHMCMSDAGGSLAAFASLNVRRKIYVHLNNTNPALLADSTERAALEAHGWQVATDGMEIEL
ncbi:MAG: pyrroloquinoline quinone biosynthesis protein PqqB [Rhodospirillales bacterium]|nr:pyrroloquinoline quinone biosynthesis protein PqqB [Rhodospirillales bacterium]